MIKFIRHQSRRRAVVFVLSRITEKWTLGSSVRALWELKGIGLQFLNAQNILSVEEEQGSRHGSIKKHWRLGIGIYTYSCIGVREVWLSLSLNPVPTFCHHPLPNKGLVLQLNSCLLYFVVRTNSQQYLRCPQSNANSYGFQKTFGILWCNYLWMRPAMNPWPYSRWLARSW